MKYKTTKEAFKKWKECEKEKRLIVVLAKQKVQQANDLADEAFSEYLKCLKKEVADEVHT